MEYRLPNTFILGVQKSATTWLYRQLEVHNSVFASNPKELFFFDKPRDSVSDKIDYYKKYFVSDPNKSIYLEASATYFWLRSQQSIFDDKISQANNFWTTHQNILETLGRDVKFIVIFRNPISRAISAFYHNFKRGRIPSNSSILLQGQKYGVLDMGLYKRSHQKWISTFSPDSFLFLNFDDINKNPQSTLNQATDFLNISRTSLRVEDSIYNSGLQLHDYGKFIGVKSGASKVINQSQESTQKTEPSVSAEFLVTDFPRVFRDEIRILRRWYLPSIKHLENELGWDLTHWKETDHKTILNH